MQELHVRLIASILFVAATLAAIRAFMHWPGSVEWGAWVEWFVLALCLLNPLLVGWRRERTTAMWTGTIALAYVGIIAALIVK